MNSEALFIPEPCNSPHESCVLSKKIAALQLVPTGGGGARLGPISHLLPGTRLEVCGEGFNDRTVKVQSKEHFYFVFWQDIVADTARFKDGV